VYLLVAVYVAIACAVTLHNTQYAAERPAFGAGSFEEAVYPCDLLRTCLCDTHSQQVEGHSNEFQARLRQRASHSFCDLLHYMRTVLVFDTH
jgi:hypothetical protein